MKILHDHDHHQFCVKSHFGGGTYSKSAEVVCMHKVRRNQGMSWRHYCEKRVCPSSCPTRSVVITQTNR